MPWDFGGGNTQSKKTSTKWDFGGSGDRNKKEEDVQALASSLFVDSTPSFDPEVSDPSLQWKAAQTKTTPPPVPNWLLSLGDVGVLSEEPRTPAEYATKERPLDREELKKVAMQGILGFSGFAPYQGFPGVIPAEPPVPVPEFTPQEFWEFKQTLEPQTPFGKVLGFGASMVGQTPWFAAGELTGGAPLAAKAAQGLGRLAEAVPKLAPAVEKATSYVKSAVSGAGTGFPLGMLESIGEGEGLPESLKEGAKTAAIFGGFNVAGRAIGEGIKALRKPRLATAAEKAVGESRDIGQDGLRERPKLFGKQLLTESVTQKEPWQMTREEFISKTPPGYKYTPSEVLKNYPDITKPEPVQPIPEGVGAQKFTIPEKMAPVGEGQRVRSLGVSAMRADYTHPDVKAGLLMETYPGGSGVYEEITNKETIAKAREIIGKSIKDAERYIKENPGTALSNTISLELVKKANAEGRFDDAIDLIQEVSQKATTQGQAIQSLRLWGNMTPEGMQKFYVKTIENINKELEKKFIKKAEKLQVKPEIMEQIKTNMEKVAKLPEGRERDIEIAKTLDLIASQVPVPFLRKVASIQTMAQLLNPKTAIRNIIGNVGFAGLENISGVVGAAIDRPLSLITGQRTKVMPSLTAQAKGFKQGWKHGLEDALLGIDTSGIASKFDLPRGRVFRSGPLGFAEKVLNIELRATDRAFYQAAYEDSLLNQMRAAKTNTPTEEMRNIAHLDGLYRTFQDDNALSNLFVGIKRVLNANKEFGIGDFIIKYPRTPANLLARGLDYSPAGFVKVILEAARPLAKQKFNQKAFVESFSRALVGSTALFGTGALLHKLGIITGRAPEDRDLAELQRQQGFGEYRINVSALKRLVFGNGNPKPQKGDTIISYDWFQPHAIPVAIGADIDANKGTNKGIVGTLMNALGTGINAFAEQPVVQGIQTLFSGGYGDWTTGLVKVLETVPSSFVPTLLSQINQLLDNQRRETYSPDKGQEALNKVAAKIPGLAGSLPKKYGTLGQPLETYQGGGNTPFNVFLNPAFVNTYNPSREVQMVFSLYEQTGETKQVPRVVDKTITVSGKKFVLSGKEYAEYQRLVGKYTQEGFAKMSGSLKPEAAVKRMQEIMTDANTKAKTEILKARGERVYKKGSGIAVK